MAQTVQGGIMVLEAFKRPLTSTWNVSTNVCMFKESMLRDKSTTGQLQWKTAMARKVQIKWI